MFHVLYFPLTIWMNTSSILNYMAAIFVSNGKLNCLTRFVYFASTLTIATFCLSEVCLWVECDNAVFHLLPHSPFSVDIKKTSEDIQPTAPWLHFRYKQGLKSKCKFFYDTQINMHIQNNKNEGYVTVEFKLQQLWSLRCILVWHNTV